jgi:hypothetical protein
MKLGNPIEMVRSDEILPLVKMITFRFEDGLFGFCLKENDHPEYQITVVFSAEDAATEFHVNMIKSYINNNLPKNVRELLNNNESSR